MAQGQVLRWTIYWVGPNISFQSVSEQLCSTFSPCFFSLFFRCSSFVVRRRLSAKRLERESIEITVLGVGFGISRWKRITVKIFDCQPNDVIQKKKKEKTSGVQLKTIVSSRSVQFFRSMRVHCKKLINWNFSKKLKPTWAAPTRYFGFTNEFAC